MPLSKYFKGDGPEVMAEMQKRYGAKKGKQVFYATANKQKHHKHKGHSSLMALRKRKR